MHVCVFMWFHMFCQISIPHLLSWEICIWPAQVHPRVSVAISGRPFRQWDLDPRENCQQMFIVLSIETRYCQCVRVEYKRESVCVFRKLWKAPVLGWSGISWSPGSGSFSPVWWRNQNVSGGAKGISETIASKKHKWFQCRKLLWLFFHLLFHHCHYNTISCHLNSDSR